MQLKMKIKTLIKILLDESEGITTMDIRVDGSVPIPLEKVFEIKAGKSWLLFKPRKLEHKDENKS